MFAYEFLYFSLDKSLPEEIIINYQPNKILKSKQFHSFDSRIRKSIIFINIPLQKVGDNKIGSNLLNIYLCNKEKIKLYGTFSLDTIEIKTTKPYEYKQVVINNIMNIYDDYIENYEKHNQSVNFIKYFSFDSGINKSLENEINESFHLYNYENSQHTLKYFNSLCLWNFYYFIKKSHNPISRIKEYINLYKKLIVKDKMTYIEISMILVGFILRVFEDKTNFKSPKFFFYDELDDSNPYKIAFNFQFNLIENINEDSCLFQPFLFLDSYVMNCIYYKNFNFVKIVIPAYSISMVSIESIKDHLRKSIKNYFFVLEKEDKKIIEDIMLLYRNLIN